MAKETTTAKTPSQSIKAEYLLYVHNMETAKLKPRSLAAYTKLRRAVLGNVAKWGTNGDA